MPDVCPNRTACSLGASRGVELPYTCGSPSISVFIFFSQAVDGIRAHCVTGVQTCALPILAGPGVSLVSTATLVEPSSATVARSLTATGGSLTSVTVTATSAVEQRTSRAALVVPLSQT